MKSINYQGTFSNSGAHTHTRSSLQFSLSLLFLLFAPHLLLLLSTSFALLPKWGGVNRGGWEIDRETH